MRPTSTSTGIHERRPDGCYSLQESVAACAEAGFSHVDLTFCHWCGHDQPIARDDYVSFADDIGDRLSRHGVAPNQAHANFYLHGVSSQEDAFQALMTRRCLEIAGRLHIPNIVMHILRVKDIGSDDKALGMAKNVEYFKPYGDLARRYGVRIAIENGLTGFFHSADELLELLCRLNDDAFGLCWDTGHANITGQDQPAAIKKMGARLLCVHLNDNDGQKDQHLLPYMGTVDFAPIARALRESGFAGVFTLESGGFTKDLPSDARPAALKLAHNICAVL